jgi:hypothetical protein
MEEQEEIQKPEETHPLPDRYVLPEITYPKPE